MPRQRLACGINRESPGLPSASKGVKTGERTVRRRGAALESSAGALDRNERRAHELVSPSLVWASGLYVRVASAVLRGTGMRRSAVRLLQTLIIFASERRQPMLVIAHASRLRSRLRRSRSARNKRVPGSSRTRGRIRKGRPRSRQGQWSTRERRAVWSRSFSDVELFSTKKTAPTGERGRGGVAEDASQCGADSV